MPLQVPHPKRIYLIGSCSSRPSLSFSPSTTSSIKSTASKLLGITTNKITMSLPHGCSTTSPLTRDDIVFSESQLVVVVSLKVKKGLGSSSPPARHGGVALVIATMRLHRVIGAQADLRITRIHRLEMTRHLGHVCGRIGMLSVIIAKEGVNTCNQY